ncbi:MAG: glycoside hydrolase family 3 C-terminal domain-containing protein [Bacteroidales bacterium]|nr:glycoside hydrolase family 3 C-terminal domain-containing protein [Candidatus Cryptobacteroides onthequi]
MRFRTIAAAIAGMLALAACSRSTARYDGPLYLNEDAPIEDRIEDALQRMTMKEKIDILHAQSKFSSKGVPRLGIPELWCTDGPHGIRAEVIWDKWRTAGWTNDSIVAYPALTCLASTWDRDLAALYGKSIGEEARYREKDVLLGPGLNIYRTPLNGRNFEYMGEDPFLAGEMAVPYIRNVQKNGVATCVKHFALNNEETGRMEVDVELSDRALYEIYLPAYKKAVTEGGSWSIMGAYNKFRGQHCCHNKTLLCDILRDEWGFDGAVITDWGGAHSTDEAALNGLDLEFGTGTNGLATNYDGYDNYYLALPYRDKLLSGELPMETLDTKVRNVLRLMMRTSMKTRKPLGSICSDEHYAAAKKIGEDGIVLLKNDASTLPIRLEECSNILVVGENAIKMMTVGGGSSSLKAQHEILPLEGIVERAGDAAKVTFARGYVGDPTGEYDGIVAKQDLAETRGEQELIDDAVALAKEADFTIFIGGLNKGENQDCEGGDRYGIELPYAQDALISALAQATQKLAVVFVSGNAVAMPWVDSVPAIVEAWYMGSEAGHSLASVLFGDACPSGKLPFTFPVRLEDCPAHALDPVFPHMDTARYVDDIYVGYRGYERSGVKPLFAFGHGLSYTTFAYSGVRADKSKVKNGGSVTISADITNTGKVAGAEIVQLYISDLESRLDRPAKELKGFDKVWLEPGQTKTVSITVSVDDLRYFDPEAHAWTVEPGEFEAHIAAASDDIRGSVRFSLQ